MDNAVPAGTRHRLTTRERAGLIAAWRSGARSRPGVRAARARADWDEPLLLGVLCALAVIAIFHDVPLIRRDPVRRYRQRWHSSPSRSSARCPALAVIFPPIAVNALCGRERLLRAGNLANLAAYGWYTLVGGLCWRPPSPTRRRPRRSPGCWPSGSCSSSSTGPSARPSTARCGSVTRCARSWQMLRDALPAGATMAALGAHHRHPLRLVRPARARAVRARRGPAAERADLRARTRPVALLDPLTAARRYAAALAVHLRLDRDARRELDAVIRLAHARDVDGDPGEHLGHAVVDWSEVSCAAGHVTEWWNGAGGPAGRARHDHPALGAHRRRRAHLGGAHRRGKPAAGAPRGALAPRGRRRRTARSRASCTPPASSSRRSACRRRSRRPSRACITCASRAAPARPRRRA